MWFSSPKEIVFPTIINPHLSIRKLINLIGNSEMHNSAIRVLSLQKGNLHLDEDQETNKQLLKMNILEC